MRPMTYIAQLEPTEDGSILVRFPDVPEALTEGRDREDAVRQAADALDVALEGYLERDEDFPPRSELEVADRDDLVEIAVQPGVAGRAYLMEMLRRHGMSKVAFATLWGRDEKVVRRVLSGQGASLELTFDALRAVGARPAVGFLE